jgi:tetratricopeptide (TPR) repeat protein
VNQTAKSTALFAAPLLALALAAPASGRGLPAGDPAPAPAADPAPAALAVVPYAGDPAIAAMAHRVAGGKITTRQKLEAIVQLIFDRRHGLGFEYQSHPTLTAIEAAERRRGNCLSLVNLFVAMSRSADIHTFFVEVEDFETFERRGDAVVRSTHVVGGVNLGTELRTIDFMPDRPKVYRRLRVLTDRQATAHYFNAIGAEALLDGEIARAEPLLRRALDLDPELPEAWNNLGLTARRAGRLPEAIAHLEQALAVEPGFVPALENLAGFYRMAGDAARAGAAAARALELRTRNPYYLLMQAVDSLRDGRLEEAEELARRARRLDKRIPEVHVVLGRLALARGDSEAAAESFARAQRLGAGFPATYQHRLETKIDRLVAARL